jgi:hypothetical protein
MVFPKGLRGDIDGRGKLVLDWLVSRNLTVDDSHCWGLFLERGDSPDGIAQIEVAPYAESFDAGRPRAVA